STSHPESPQEEDENVEVLFLRPNMTSLLQPLDQGIIIKCAKVMQISLTVSQHHA
ncbi:hypothetical protein SK128_016222, partial [Halocaridina rubra]